MQRNHNKIGPNLISCALMQCLSVDWWVSGDFAHLSSLNGNNPDKSISKKGLPSKFVIYMFYFYFSCKNGFIAVIIIRKVTQF